MKRIVTALTLSSLMLLLAVSFASASSDTLQTVLQVERDGDRPPTGVRAAASSSPKFDDEHFSADTGGELDQYLFRTQGDGYIRFNIPITRYYFAEADARGTWLTEEGFLIIDNVDTLLDKHILPETATLRLRVYDVDENASWCPEVDYIYVNDFSITESGTRSKLSGADDEWSSPSFRIPIQTLKFPTAKGSNGAAPQAVNNEIAIQIDASECTTSAGNPAWAVEVDWGEIHIPSPIRPVILAHGWTGTPEGFADFETWLDRDGIPAAPAVDLERGIYSIAQTALWLRDPISNAVKEYGVDKVNIFAHSKGGLVTRKALRDDELAKHVDHVVTFASPHHGTMMAESTDLLMLKCAADYKLDLVKAALCVLSGQELSRDNIRENFNYTGCKQNSWSSQWTGCTLQHKPYPSIEFYSFAANGDEAVVPLRSTTYPWKADKAPFPGKIDVDQRFDLESGLLELGDHGQIMHVENSYKCAISYLDASVYAAAECPSGTHALDGSQPPPPKSSSLGDDYQPILNQDGTLAPRVTREIVSNVDGGTTALFKVFSDGAITYNLTDPNGRSINPAVAGTDPNITYSARNNGSLWFYQYRVSSPSLGSWKNKLWASDATNYVVSNWTDSPVRLHSITERHTYRPGETVTLEAVVASGSTPHTGVALVGSARYPDNTTSTLLFYDDGSHGDRTPNDGIYTVQFTAPSTNGYTVISLSAAKGTMTRVSETSIAIASQTARFHQITREAPLDSNGNGLYDRLDIHVSVDVIQSGHFDLRGNLVDGSGKSVASAYYSTLMENNGPLSAGRQTVILSFDGTTIQKHRADGPYTLADLTIMDVSEHTLQVDARTNVHTTAAYRSDQFERPMIALAGSTDTPLDRDGNGRYDALQIGLEVEVVLSGNYTANGRLIDPKRGEITWTQITFYASSTGSQHIVFEFDGRAIGSHRVDGPYTLLDLSVTKTDGASSEVFAQAHTTRPYSFTEFEGGCCKTYLPTLLYNYAPGPLPPNRPPNTPSNPTPYNGAANQGVNVSLRWTGGDPDNHTVTYDVYLEAGDNTPDNLVCSSTTNTTCVPGTLSYQTRYYWKVVARDPRGAVTSSSTWTFTTASRPNNPPYVPSAPSPGNNAINQSVDVNLGWSGGDPDGDDVTYDVYLEANDPTPNDIVCNDRASSTCDPGTLNSGTRYYWKVVATDEHGASSTGPIWAFTTGTSNNPPHVPSVPSPSNNATNQSIDANLAWTGGDPDEDDDVTYDVYLEADDSTPDNLVCSDVPTSSCDPGTLDSGTHYYWKVIAADEHGASRTGPTWDFTTRSAGWREVGAGSASGGGISNNSGLSHFPMIAVAPDNTPYVAWLDDTGGSKLLVKRWTGSAWQQVGSGIPASDSRMSWLTIAPNGTPYVAWHDDSSGDHEIYVRRWNGSSWVEIGGSASGGGISNNSTTSKYPKIAVGSDNVPYVAWTDSAGGWEIYIRRWNGSSWVEVGSGSATGGGISDNAGQSNFPVLGLTTSNRPYVVWRDDSGGNRELYARQWNGSNWVNMGSGSANGGGISSTSGASQHPSMVPAPNDTPYVAWNDDTRGNFEIYTRKWNGSSWSTVGSGSASGGGISNNSGDSMRSSPAVTPGGAPYIAWADESSGDYEIYVRRWNGSQWVETHAGSATAGGISNNSGESDRPSMAVAPDGTIYLAWQDDSSGDFEIYVLRW